MAWRRSRRVRSLDVAVGIGGYEGASWRSRSGVSGQDDADAARGGGVPEGGRRGGVHRRRARAGRELRAQPRRERGRLLVSQPDTGEQALEIAEMPCARAGGSRHHRLGGCADAEGGARARWATRVGLQARLMSQALRKLTGSVNKSNCCLFFINQIVKISVMFGSPETTSSGKRA